MELDTLLDAAKKDRQVLEAKRDGLVEEIERFRESKLDEIRGLEGEMKRIDKVLKAAGAVVTGKPSKSNSLSKLNISLERVTEAAEWCAQQTGQFRLAEIRIGTNLRTGQETYAARALTALGWLTRTDDPSHKGRFWVEWAGPKPEKVAAALAAATETKPQGGWKFKDDNVQQAAVARR